jgi:hypothetical protein
VLRGKHCLGLVSLPSGCERVQSKRPVPKVSVRGRVPSRMNKRPPPELTGFDTGVSPSIVRLKDRKIAVDHCILTGERPRLHRGDNIGRETFPRR